MKKAKKIGLSLNKKVVSNLTRKQLTGGTGPTSGQGTTCLTRTTQAHNTCAAGCGSGGQSQQECTVGCAD